MNKRSPEELVAMMRRVSSRLELKSLSQQTNNHIDVIKTAVKRSKHFTKSINTGGPFSPVGKTGLSIPIRNGLQILDLNKSITEKRYRMDLSTFEFMAQAINKWIDSHMIEGDEEAAWALGAFLSRIWFNVEKLEC